MGLDMYLDRKYYIRNWDHTPEDRRHTITILRGGQPSPIPTEKIKYLVTEEVYWRKANQIHAWFVKNVQEGNDDCKEYYVSREQLAELLDTVKKVLADHLLAPELLPAQEGFFFGSLDYNEDYFKDLEHTQTELERLLVEPEDGDIQYHSSW